MPRKLELTEREMYLMRNALARYKVFCENCVSAFKGTGHDEHYKRLIERIDSLDMKVYSTLTNNTDKEMET